MLQLLDVAVNNPRGLGAVTSSGLSGASPVVASVAAVALLWAFGRNISAYFAGSDGALARGFRYLRFFFVLWTYATAVTVLMLLFAVWQAL
jgi:hypothetical protein